MGWVRHASPEVAAQSQYPSIVAVAISLTVLMTIIVCLRAYVRMVVIKRPGWDDYVTFAAAVISIIYNAMAVWQTRLGLGLPVALRPTEDASTYAVVNFAGRPLYMACITGYKVALCLAYLRILQGTKHGFQKIIFGILIFVVVSHLASTLVIVFQCTPVEKSYNPFYPKDQGFCLANYPTWNATAGITIFCDVVVFLLPVPIFIKLQVSRRRKIGLIFLFVLGLFTTVCSVMRMVQIKLIAATGNNSTLVLWGTAEMNVGLALSCVPAIKPLWDRIAKKPKASHSGYTMNNYDEQTASTLRMNKMSRASVSAIDSKNKMKATAHFDDQSSEENILPSHGADSGSQWITKTTEWQVQRDDAR